MRRVARNDERFRAAFHAHCSPGPLAPHSDPGDLKLSKGW